MARVSEWFSYLAAHCSRHSGVNPHHSLSQLSCSAPQRSPLSPLQIAAPLDKFYKAEGG